MNHDFVYNPPQPVGPKTYTGVMGYLASAASVYSAIWSANPTVPPLPPPPPTPKTCPCGPSPVCAAPPDDPVGGKGLNLTGYWGGSWDNYNYKCVVCSITSIVLSLCVVSNVVFSY